MNELESLRKEFGRLVRTKREAKNLSQDGVAKLMDMERQQIYRIENGLSGTRPETAKRLAELLDFDENLALSYAAGIKPDEGDEVKTIAERLASGVMASGFNDLEDEELREAFLADMQTIAESMLKRRLEEQDKKRKGK